jgi:hypothetical protein
MPKFKKYDMAIRALIKTLTENEDESKPIER